VVHGVTEEERNLVNAFNQYFATHDVSGIAHRKKQHRFSSQLCDVLVDSSIDQFYLAIEAKSVKTSSTNKLYFSQHFSENSEGHQVDRISDFIDRSGRTGYLAVELKRGTGRPRQAFLVPWRIVRRRYRENETGIPLDLVRQQLALERTGSQYSIDPVVDQLDSREAAFFQRQP